MHIGLVFNQKSPTANAASKAETMRLSDVEAEWDCPERIDAVADALSAKHEVSRIEANEDAFETLRKVRPDLVFNIAEGRSGPGRESQIPAMLGMLGDPLHRFRPDYAGHLPRQIAGQGDSRLPRHTHARVCRGRERLRIERTGRAACGRQAAVGRVEHGHHGQFPL